MSEPGSLRNIGPKSAAWLRQVGLHSAEDVVAAGAVEAFVRIRRAGFRPSLNLLYALEGALRDCHWHDVPDARRRQLVAEAEAASAALPVRAQPQSGPVTTAYFGDADAADAGHDGSAGDDDAPPRTGT